MSIEVIYKSGRKRRRLWFSNLLCEPNPRHYVLDCAEEELFRSPNVVAVIVREA